MENQHIYSSELSEMKEQIALLKNKLEKETIITDRALRYIMNEKGRHLKMTGRYKTLASFLSIPIIIWCTHFLGMSLLFTITSAIYLSIAFIFTYITHHNINRTDLMKDDLMVVSERVAKIKQRYSIWIYYGIPIVIGWFAWFFYELFQTHLPFHELKAALIGCVTGGIIGGAFGIKRYRKVQRVTSEILTQIEEFKDLQNR